MSLRYIEELESHSIGPLGFAARRLPHALGHRGGRALSKRSDGAGASGFSGGDAANPKHGDARRQSLPGYALQLLRSELRVAKGHQFLPEERWRHMLGRAGKPEVHGGFFDGHGAGIDRAWRASPAGFALGRARSLARGSL